jgi:hypothetical protein
MPISNWSLVAADNDDADSASGINLAEGQLANTVNDSIRAMMAVIKGDWDAVGLNTLNDAWTAYTPTIASTTTTITGTVAARYKKIGRTVHLVVYAQTSTGTGGSFLATLPVNAAANGIGQAGTGMTVNSGQALSVLITSGASQLTALKYDGTSPIAPGNILAISVVYEAAS